MPGIEALRGNAGLEHRGRWTELAAERAWELLQHSARPGLAAGPMGDHRLVDVGVDDLSLRVNTGVRPAGAGH